MMVLPILINAFGIWLFFITFSNVFTALLRLVKLRFF